MDQSTKNEDLLIENVRNRGDFEKLLAQVQQWKDSEVIFGYIFGKFERSVA